MAKKKYEIFPNLAANTNTKIQILKPGWNLKVYWNNNFKQPSNTRNFIVSIFTLGCYA